MAGESSVVFVGFAAEGTLAQQIIDGACEVDTFGERIQVRAKIWTINGFSAHADQVELQEWLGHAGHPRLVRLVHGEFGGGMAALADILRNRGQHALEAGTAPSGAAARKRGCGAPVRSRMVIGPPVG